jgi:hypothetical protein
MKTEIFRSTNNLTNIANPNTIGSKGGIIFMVGETGAIETKLPKAADQKLIIDKSHARRHLKDGFSRAEKCRA